MSTPVQPQIIIPGINQTDPSFAGTAVVTPPSQYAQNLGMAVATTETRQQLKCTALLEPDTLEKARREAAGLFPEMLNKVEVMLVWGNSAVVPLNTLNRQLLTRIKPVKVPELMASMRQLNSGMREISGRYNFQDPKVLEFYEHWKGGIGRLWGRAKSLYDLFMDDITDVVTQLDKVSKTFRGKELEMIEFNAYYDELYRQTVEELHELVYTIAVLELIAEMAAKAAEAIPVGNTAAGDQGETEKMRLTGLANNLSIRIAEFKGRLGLGWANCPMILTAQSVGVSQAVKLNSFINVGIPSMVNYLTTQRMLVEQMEASQFDELLTTIINQWVTASAKNFGTAIPIMARQANKATLWPDTFGTLTQAMADAASGVVEAVSEGQRERAELEAAALQMRDEITVSAKHMNDAVIDAVVNKASALHIKTHVPVGLPAQTVQLTGVPDAVSPNTPTSLVPGSPAPAQN